MLVEFGDSLLTNLKRFDYDQCEDKNTGKTSCLPECISYRHRADAFHNSIYRNDTDGMRFENYKKLKLSL